MIFLRGATAYEAQIGGAWVKVLRPRYINQRSLKWLVQIGWEDTCE